MAELWYLRNYKQESANAIMITLDIPVSIKPKKPLVNTSGGQPNQQHSNRLLHLSTEQAKTSKKFGHFPEKEAETIPWGKMCIDLIGPYTICRKGQANLIWKCVTMIHPATSWFKIHRYDNKRGITVTNIAKEECFSSYP